MDYSYAPGRNHLFVPGPTNIPEQVLRAMNRNNEDYRSPAVPALTKTLLEDVKKIFKTTSGTTFLIPTTGTGAWESALTNTLSPQDGIITFEMGQFSLLWIDQMQRLNFDVDVVQCEWGSGVEPEILRRKLQSDYQSKVKAICVVHNETATGVTNNLAAIRKVLDDLNHPALLLVDCVSSLCAIDFRMDEWGVDVALTGSQKALSMPTGMGILCASPKAMEASKTSKSLRVFFDWKDYIKFYNMGTYWPYTPSIQLLYGLRAALDLLFEEGLENVFARHARLGKATRLAVEAWGLKNCTKKEEWFSDTVTAVMVPPYIDSAEVVRRAWKRYNISLGLGLNKVAGRVFRIGHLGNLNEVQLLGCLSGVEMILKDVGYPVKLGSGVAAAAAYLSNSIPLNPPREIIADFASISERTVVQSFFKMAMHKLLKATKKAINGNQNQGPIGHKELEISATAKGNCNSHWKTHSAEEKNLVNCENLQLQNNSIMQQTRLCKGSCKQIWKKSIIIEPHHTT